ncbi:MAG: ABC transporter substrate-binding protein [bacterium]|nr:ABC transporter substrate-binding protein [bacterium]MDE0501450.1 ABC transporter substrate-binding protein [bacterium]
MKTRFKWLAMIMALSLIAAACGGDDEAEAPATTAAPVTTAAPATTAAPGTTAAPEEATEEATGETMAEEEPMMIATDKGVDLEAGVIKVGMLSDLTGPFGPAVNLLVAGVNTFWADVNARGGVHGLMVELLYRDTAYSVDNHVQFFEELRDEVVAFGHSTGSPHTIAILPELAEDGILAIPLTWYSGWSDPDLNANLLSHGTSYCIEAMNMIGYLSDVSGENGVADPTLAIATFPGDYGLDSAAGAKIAAETLGLEIVYDGSGQIIPSQDNAPIGNAIAQSGADIVWVAANPTTLAEVYGAALAQGLVALWSGTVANWSPAFVAPDSPIKDAMTRDFYGASYFPPYTDDSPGMQNLRDLMAQYAPEVPPIDYVIEGFVEGMILFEALKVAYENGDMTQRGVLAAAKSMEEVDFGGIAPNESYVGSPNERLQRQTWINRPDPEGLAAGTTAIGTRVIESYYTHPIAADYVFEEACYKLS